MNVYFNQIYQYIIVHQKSLKPAFKPDFEFVCAGKNSQ